MLGVTVLHLRMTPLLLLLTACTTLQPVAPQKEARAERKAAAKALAAEREAHGGSLTALDASTGGPLRRIDLTSIRVTEDVLVEGRDDVGAHVAECDPSFGSVLGQHWYTFGDDECYSGTSLSLVQLLHSGRDGLGCTIRWLGTVKPTHADPFTGVGQDITRAELGSFNIIHLQVRGDGRRYRAQFPLEEQMRQGAEIRTNQPLGPDGQPDCHDDWYDFYGQEFRCGDGTDVWSALDVDLRKLRQNGFGKAWAWKQEDAKRFQIVTQEHEPHDFQCEFRIIGLE